MVGTGQYTESEDDFFDLRNDLSDLIVILVKKYPQSFEAKISARIAELKTISDENTFVVEMEALFFILILYS